MRRKHARSKQDYTLLKQKARELRKKGKSYSEIIQKLTLSKSTVSGWCKDIKLSKLQIEALGNRYDVRLRGAKANQLKRKREVEKIRKAAQKEIKKPSMEAFRMAGTMLYWAEGNKSNHLGITNSNPKMIVFMVRWFEKFFNIKPEQLKAHLHLHAGQDEQKVKIFWVQLTNVPENRFGKTYIKPEGTGHRKNILYNGTIRLSFYNKDLLHKMLTWIDSYEEHITGR